MGIVGYYDWLKKQYPKVSSRMTSARRYDHVMIDMNHILHHAIHKAHNEASFQIRIYKSLDYLLSRCLAYKSIYLAVDGPPPFAKIALQRKRRGTVDEKMAKKKISSLCLTPGTVLMGKVEGMLTQYFKDRASWYRIRNPKITISPASVADEGELKAFYQIQKIVQTHPKDTFCVVGNDADLVVLAMASQPAHQIDVLVRINRWYEYISISHLLTRLYHQLYPKTQIQQVFSLRNHPVRHDFAVVSMMMGNDYLSKLSYLKVEVMWQEYFAIQKSRGDYLIRDGKFDREFLIEWSWAMSRRLASQFRRRSRFYQEMDIEQYLAGFLWCLKMYHLGICPKVDYLYEGKTPSPYDIHHYLTVEKGPLPEIPTSETKAVSHEIYSLLVMPKKAKHLLDPRCQQMMEQGLEELYEQEVCAECQELRSRCSLANKEMIALRKKEEDDTEVRKKLSQIAKDRTAHKKTHTKEPSINEIVQKVQQLAQAGT